MVEIGKVDGLSIKGIQAYGLHLDGGTAGDILLMGISSEKSDIVLIFMT